MSLSSHPKRLVNKKILHTVILFYNSRITAIAHRASVTPITEEHFLLNKVVFSIDILQFIVNMSYCLVRTVTGSAEIHCFSRNKLQREWSYNFLRIMLLVTDILTILRKFHCIFPQTPCMGNPCQHGTSFCRPIYNRDDYQCVCKAGFTGKHCGMGQFNLLLSNIT